ncbi:hypothetical protein SDC9_178134 [bioreactor metagenome]|uniref:GDT1 family protein n=1 Tax=bioreactor metagenome TaxID=1076179 RepID=A0A645H4A6_9ZZZZ
MGSTAGMMVADAIGIIAGIVLGKRIPERTVKWFAALVFIFFGLYGLYENVPQTILTPGVMVATILVTAILIYAVAVSNRQANKK